MEHIYHKEITEMSRPYHKSVNGRITKVSTAVTLICPPADQPSII
ncbi:MAG: hypothetical protein WBO48_13110 [Candidatus Promineifilaceae bacterium]